jgi:hypothetical protein
MARRRLRKTVLVLGGLLVVVLVLAGLAPAILSTGLGRSIVGGVIDDRVNGTAAVDGLDLSWFGGQSVSGLTITDETGREAVRLDATLSTGLLALALGTVDELAVDVSGALAGTLREDGTTSFDELLAKDGGASSTGASSRGRTTPPRPPALGLPATTVVIDELVVTLDIGAATAPRTLAIDAAGTLAYRPGGESTVGLQATTADGDRTGTLELTARAVGLFDADGVMTPAGAKVDAALAASGIPVPFEERVEAIRMLEVGVRSSDLTGAVRLDLRMETELAGGAVSEMVGAVTVGAPVRPDGTVEIALERMHGAVRGADVPTALLQPFLADTPVLLARDVGSTIDVGASVGAPGGGDPGDATAAGPRAVTVDVSSEHLGLEAAAAVSADGAIEGRKLIATARVDPALAGDAIDAPASVRLEATSFTVPARDADGGLPLSRATLAGVLSLAEPLVVAAGEDETAVIALPELAIRLNDATGAAEAGGDDAVRLTVTAAAEATVEHPALEETLRIEGLEAAVTARLDGAEEAAPRYAIDGGATLRRAGAKNTLGTLAIDVTLADADGRLAPTGAVTVSDIALRQIERMLGTEAGTVTGWLGRTGAVALDVASDMDAGRLALRVDFPNLAGDVHARLDDDAVEVTAEALDLTVRRPTLERMLNPPAGDGAEPPPDVDPVTVAADLPMRLAVRRLRLPRALLAGDAFAPADVGADVTLTGRGPLVLADADGAFSTLDGLAVKVATDDLARGVSFAVTGTAGAPRVADTGTISIDGRVGRLVSDESTLDLDAARITMEAKAERVPTVIADGLLGLRTLLVAAVGPEMNAQFTSRGFSRSSGQLDLRIETTNGFLAGQVRGRKDALRTTKDAPIHGELAITPPLRERLLRRIHPILADVRTTEQPIRVAVTSNATIPLDGDTSRLRADLEITIGAVELDAGSTALGLLSLFQGAGAKSTFPGSIEPIVARIRNGIVTYDRFAVHIDKYTLAYAGRVDLVAGTVDLRTEIPLEGLADSFREVSGYVEGIVVPIVTRGPYDDPKTEIDPDFDLAAVLVEAGARGAIDEALKEQGVDLGKVLDDFLKGTRKKKK